MTAAAYDFVIEQGSTLDKAFVWKDSTGTVINLSGYTARMQIRQTVSSTTVLLELTTLNNRIIITPSEGKIRLLVAAADTGAITWQRGKYDLELVSSTGTVTRLLYGDVEVSREVTR
jgi:hypothetical protein